MCDLWRDADDLRWFLQTCPWHLINSPAIEEVMNCYKWFSQNQLSIRYPDAPLILLDAVSAFDNGFQGGRSELWERESNDRRSID